MMDGEAKGVAASSNSCWRIGKKNSMEFFVARGEGFKPIEGCSRLVFGGNISSGLGGTFEK